MKEHTPKQMRSTYNVHMSQSAIHIFNRGILLTTALNILIKIFAILIKIFGKASKLSQLYENCHIIWNPVISDMSSGL